MGESTTIVNGASLMPSLRKSMQGVLTAGTVWGDEVVEVEAG